MKVLVGGSTSLSFISSVRLLAKTMSKIYRRQGIKGLTLSLKAATVLLQQSVAGYVLYDVTPLGPRLARTGSGLPRLIPACHRLLIINKRPGYLLFVRFYLTVFSVYRVLEFPGKLKLNTITDPGKSFDISWFEPYVPAFTRLMSRGSKDPLDFFRAKAKAFPIFKSSPFTDTVTTCPLKEVNLKGLYSTHVVSLLEATRAVYLSSAYSIIMKMATVFYPELRRLFTMLVGLKKIDQISNSIPKKFESNWWSGLPLGKLSLKKEAAGKVRVFAMVDPITQ